MKLCYFRRSSFSLLFVASLAAFTATALRAANLTLPADDGQSNGPRVTALIGQLELGSDIVVKIMGLSAWAGSHDATKLVPFINGRAIRGIYPEELHASANHVQFELRITKQNQPVWIDLLGEPEGLRKPVEFSVGLEGQTPFASDLERDRSPSLIVIPQLYGWISFAVVIATLMTIVRLARKTDIIRDAGPAPGGGRLKPYNLGRTQMAFWFFLTFASYIAIWLITEDIDTITPSLLGLMGISTGTALAEVMIDANKDTTAADKVESAVAEKQALEESIAQQQTQLGALIAKPTPAADDATVRDSLNRQLLDQRTRFIQLTQQIKTSTPRTGPNVSRGFFHDILSNGEGYSFHRFQIFAWTIAMGLMFMAAVFNRLTMPEFSATMLGLMGMSSGAYIGFKIPEQR